MTITNIPLLNDYKKQFVFKRIPQTFLGGPNLRLGYSAPFYVYLCQIVIWLLPWLIGGIFALATELGGLSILIGSILTGVLIGLFVLTVQIIHICKRTQQPTHLSSEETTDLTSSQQFRQLFADDDEVFFSSFCSITTFKFVIPSLQFPPSIIIHAIFSGCLCGVGFWYTLPSVLNQLYNGSVPATVLIYIFSWIAFCIAHYPLNSGGIPEVAVFRSVDLYDIASMSRAFHIFIIFSFHIVEVFVPSFQAVNQVLHVVLLFLPFLWLSGILPPLDALLLWMSEQVLVFGLGGSPYATDLRFFISFVLSGAVLIGACFLSSISALVLYSALFGFLLSTDFVSLLLFLSNFVVSHLSSSKDSQHNSHQSLSRQSAHFKEPVSIFNMCWHALVFALLAVVAVVCTIYRDQALLSDLTKTVLHILFIVLLVVCMFLQDIQRVFVIFRLFRNCLYPDSYSTSHFSSRKKTLEVFGYINVALVTVVSPLLMSSYLSLYLFDTILIFFSSFVHAVGAVHAFRMIWQRSTSALVVFAVMSIIRLAISSSVISLGWFDTSSVGVQLLVLDICIDRAFKFLDNLWFALSLLVTSWTDKKQRRNSSLLLLMMNILCFPIVIVIIAIASLLSSPLLPFFTLPLFYIGFPRPSRFWPRTPGAAPASVCSDSSYYRQMAPGVSRALARGLYLGPYSTFSATASSFFLVRSQDKTIWVQTLESGYGYVSYSIKGLELQETSCHALEATRLDDQCNDAFEKPEVQRSCLRTNMYPITQAVTPLDTTFVDGYSDAKNSLSGIIDNPTAIKQIHKDFMKSLVWLMLQRFCEKRQSESVIPLLEDSAKTKRSNFTDKQSDAFSDKMNNGKAKASFSSAGINLHSLENGRLSVSGIQNQLKTSNFVSNQNGNNPTNLQKSSPSLTSILSTDDELLTTKRNQAPKPPAHPPGYVDMSDNDDLWDLDSELSDSGFGLPVKNVFAAKKDTKREEFPIRGTPTAQLSTKKDVFGWGPTPLGDDDIRKHSHLFDRSWYLHVASLTEETGSGVEEDELLKSCREMALTCYMIVFVQGVPGRNPSLLGPSHICKVFNDDIPWSRDADWMRERPDLHETVLQAHRFAVKMMYDRVVMGTVDDASDEDYDGIVMSLRELQSDWFIGPEGSDGWKTALGKEVPSLFSVHFDTEKDEYSARILLRRPMEAHVCRLSSAAVRSIWANLSIELLFATNDDEERYSIQAHTSLIRNLTVQAADPPLGYPIFSSLPVYEVALPLPTLAKR